MSNEEMPKIAERVKFWEEQDRINKVVIPRLLKNHDLITDVSKSVAAFTDSLVKIESKCANLETQVNTFKADVSKSVAAFTDSLVKIESKRANLETQVNTFKAAVSALGKKAFIISICSVILSFLAIIIVLFK